VSNLKESDMHNFFEDQQKMNQSEIKKQLSEAQHKNSVYQRVVDDLQEAIKHLEGDSLGQNSTKTNASSSFLSEKLAAIQQKMGQLEMENRAIRKEKAENELKITELEKALEEQNLRVEQEVKGLILYNSKLQEQASQEKKNFVEYLNQMNNLHINRQHNQIGAKTDHQDELHKVRRAVLERDHHEEAYKARNELEMKKLQSELDIAHEFGNSHLREIENLKWENERLHDEVNKLREWKDKMEKELNDKSIQLQEAYLDLNRVQRALKKARDEGRITEDLDALFQPKQKNPNEEKKPDNQELSIEKYEVLTKEQFIKLWEHNKQKHQIRPKLLNKILTQKNLLNWLLQDRVRLLKYLHDSLCDEDPDIYEGATQVFSYMVDNQKIISPNEKLQPYSSLAALKSLCSQRRGEAEEFVLSRHYASLNVLDYLIDNGLAWDKKMVQLAEKYGTINTLISYLGNTNRQKLWQKRKALKILKNLLESVQYELIPEVIVERGLNLFLENIEDTDPFILRNATDALSIISNMPRAQNYLEKENTFKSLIQRLINEKNKEIELSILSCILNMSRSPKIQRILCRQNINDLFLKIASDHRETKNIQVLYQIFINITQSIQDKIYFYQQIASILARDISDINKPMKKLALAFLALLIKETSTYETDTIIFPSVIQSLEYDDSEIQLLSIQIVFLLCARFKISFINYFLREKGLEYCTNLYCTSAEPNIFHVAGNLMLLVASTDSEGVQSLVNQGGYPLIRHLFKDLENSDFQVLFRAANLLQLVSSKVDMFHILGEPNEKLFSLKSFLVKLLQAPKINEELIFFGIKILNAVISPETMLILRKLQIMELLIAFLVRKIPNSESTLDILNCIANLLFIGMKQGIVADFVAEDRGRGFEVLSNTIRPAKKNNVIAQNSMKIWQIIAGTLDVRILNFNYQQKLVEILTEVFQESDIPDLRIIIKEILNQLQQ